MDMLIANLNSTPVQYKRMKLKGLKTQDAKPSGRNFLFKILDVIFFEKLQFHLSQRKRLLHSLRPFFMPFSASCKSCCSNWRRKRANIFLLALISNCFQKFCLKWECRFKDHLISATTVNKHCPYAAYSTIFDVTRFGQH